MSETDDLERELKSPTPGLTADQSETLNWLIHDPDWDCSQRGDAHELLGIMRDRLRAKPLIERLKAACAKLTDEQLNIVADMAAHLAAKGNKMKEKK